MSRAMAGRASGRAAVAGLVVALTIFLGGASDAGPRAPRYDHVVAVIEENHDAAQVMGSPYLAALAARGASFSAMHGVAHPSEPNYIALFSGSTRGVTDDRPYDLGAPNLATSLKAAGLSFSAFSEGLPSPGSRVVENGMYARKHNPAASFTNLDASTNLPFSAFPSDFRRLPTVSFVIPDLGHDMHDGSVAAGDAWLRQHLDAYSHWAQAHNSLLVVTFDEGAEKSAVDTTPIATILVGAGVRHVTVQQPANLYSLLRMIEDFYGLPALAGERTAPPIQGAWD